jgi:hypothetical protein
VAYLLASSLPSTERSFPASWRENLGEEERIARSRPLAVGFFLLRKAAGGALRCSEHPGHWDGNHSRFTLLIPGRRCLHSWRLWSCWRGTYLYPFTRVHYAHFQISSFFFFLFFSFSFFHAWNNKVKWVIFWVVTMIFFLWKKIVVFTNKKIGKLLDKCVFF